MSQYVRDTAFGHLVRLISGNRRLQFPDEQDPTLWKRCVRKDPTSTASTSHELAILSQPDEPSAADPSDDVEKAQFPASGAPAANSQGPERRGSGPERPEIGDDTTVLLVDWYGPDDQENPRNWTEPRKVIVALQICVLNFAVYSGSAIYTPGERSVMEEFGVGEVVATLGLSMFVLGYGLGPMLFSPMSEMPAIGRGRIYFWTLFGFVVLQLPVGYAVNIAMLLVFRFFTGFLGGTPLATGGATITDMYPPDKASYWICIWGAWGILGPVLGPIMGGFAAQAKGWRWTIWELTWLTSAVLILLFFLMPESNPANILYRRAQRLRKATGDPRFKSQSELDSAHFKLKDHLVMLGRAFTLTIFEPIVFLLSLYTALLYGVLYIWFESFPLVFGDMYGFNIGQQGLVFLGILVGGIIAVPGYLLWLRLYLVPQFKQPDMQPEANLPATFFGALALPVCLFWFAWTSNPNIHWIVPIVGSGWFTISIVTLFPPVLNYMGMIYPQYAASVFAGNALFRASFGVVFPLFARAMFRKLGVGPGNSLLGGLSVLFIPIPFALFFYGKRIRHWSKNARHDD